MSCWLAASRALAGTIVTAPDCLASGWPHEYSDLQPDPSLTFGTLPNGVRYILKTNSEPQDRVAVFLGIGAGSLYEEDSERGLAHFLEHMVFNGSTHFEPGELVEYFQSIGMSFGGDTNAQTGYEDTVYKLILPRGQQDDLDRGLLVMRDFAGGASLLETEVERERGVILAEKTARDSADYRAYIASISFTMQGTIIPERPIIGTEQVLRYADKEDLQGFYTRWYRPDNMLLVLVGDFSKETAVPLITKHFASLKKPSDEPRCPDYGKVDHSGTDAFYHFVPDQGSTDVSLSVIRNDQYRHDSFAFEKEHIYRYMTARLINFRLKRLTEKADTPFSSTAYYDAPMFGRYRIAEIHGTTDGDLWQKALAELDRVIRQVMDYGFTEEEVIRVKNEVAAEMKKNVLTENTRGSVDIARQIIRSFQSDRVYQSPQQEHTLFAPVVAAATPELLHRIFTQEWEGTPRLVQVIGDAQVSRDAPDAYVKDYFASLQKHKIAPPEYAKKVVFPYLAPMQAEAPLHKESSEDVDARHFRYENGLVVNFKATDFKKNTVRVALHFGDGRKSSSLPGIELPAQAIVNGSGTGTLKKTELDGVLSASSLEYGFKIGEESFSLEGQAVTEEFELLLQVLQSILLDPGFSPDVYSVAMNNFSVMYQQLAGDIQGGIKLTVEPFLAGNVAGFGLPPFSVFKSLTLEDVKAWLVPYFQGAPLEISVVGDIEAAQVERLVSSYFGGLPKRDYSATFEKAPRFPAGKEIRATVETSIDKAAIIFAWSADDFWDISRTRRLHVLAAILEDRLRLVVREKLGASYSPSVYVHLSRAYPGYGKIVAQVIVDTASIDLVQKELQHVAESMARTPVSEEELNRAKRPILTSLHDAVRSNDYWLQSVLTLSSRHRQQLLWPLTIIADFSSVTTDDIAALTARYLTEDRRAVAIVRPVEAVNPQTEKRE